MCFKLPAEEVMLRYRRRLWELYVTMRGLGIKALWIWDVGLGGKRLSLGPKEIRKISSEAYP